MSNLRLEGNGGEDLVVQVHWAQNDKSLLGPAYHSGHHLLQYGKACSPGDAPSTAFLGTISVNIP